ncbi:hypothetical protein BYT27DRAFT_7188270 [Phlegmacium glaucopus]|nr:hypothetical protein BYT27DRAFT_7188270 [Phlegmacium glaucopus]
MHLVPVETTSRALYLPYDHPPRDVYVSALTGCGKTLAYVLPIIEVDMPEVLVYSDPIPRGADISHVSNVVSYDVPVDIPKYVHPCWTYSACWEHRRSLDVG